MMLVTKFRSDRGQMCKHLYILLMLKAGIDSFKQAEKIWTCQNLR